MSRISTLIGAMLRPFWRMTRGLTLGAQGVVFNKRGEVLLVRHGYRPGWHFPGGGVEWRETVETALKRELVEETGVEVEVCRLFGFYSNEKKFPGDHVALFIVEKWRQPHVPPSNREICEQHFFPCKELPAGTSEAVKTRLEEIRYENPPSPYW